MNLLKITQQFKTQDEALDYLIQARWPNGVRCLACGSAKIYSIVTHGKTKKIARLFECADCSLHFSATTGTLFHDSHLPLQKWFMAMALMCEAKKGISANQVARHIGVQYKTAWHLCHRIRRAMEEKTIRPLGSEGQVVEIDDVYLGGRIRRKGVQAGRDNKVPVLGLAERRGRIHLEVIDRARAAFIKPVLDAHLSPNVTQVVTDAASVYTRLLPKEKHLEVIHRDELETKGWTSSQTVEGVFSLFKRGLIGSYHKLSKDHLNNYLQEFCYRYNRRGQQKEMFAGLLRDLTQKPPLKYKALTREF